MAIQSTKTSYYKLPVDVPNPEHDGRSKHDIYKSSKVFKAGTSVKVVVETEDFAGVSVAISRVYLDGKSIYKTAQTELGKALLRAVEGQGEVEKTLEQALDNYDPGCVLETLVKMGIVSITNVESAIQSWDDE